ncbi:hypothetical protein HXX76_006221 [Chlamydomonas incerta]|uniref:Kinesin-like protein n=1 Tax=Chlamydomonas incerta TaxID=51695 RepID=A0A835W484_CHLIN|nr:hypothetical protein HXX76_006221 [Chlamydomonas incerta]|eukprot:KAG2436693.1 hypothetical protein HXX76_006221 [Chlamydomonas incerta]
MAYGASGTGKSYTMQGTSAQPGMVPRTLSRLYQLLEERGKDHQVQLCFYEVYENRVYDLLQSARLGKRQAQHLPIQVLGANCCVPGLLRCHCTSADAGQRLYAAASRIRTQSATQTNSESSRSHAVFTIQLLEVEKAAVTGRSATLSLVDLAGAERAGRTKNVGSKLRESANINTSLSVLGRCLEALRHNQALAARGLGSGGAPRVIPVRESSLTSLFKGVLTGQGNLVLSVHLSQHGDEYDTNRHTLRFGALASRLQMAVSAPTAAAAAALPPLPPSNHHQQQSGQGRAKRQRTQPAFEQQPPIAEAPEEEGMEEELEAGALQQEAATQEEEGARAADASNAPAGEQTGPEAEGDGADAALVELLRARVQQLQQQLVVAEETARAAAVAEWEELVASGRDELEEAQQRAEQLEEQLAAMGKELVAAQREAAAVRKELSQERAARKYREEALEKELAELRAATGSSQAPATGQARPAAARAEQRQAADRQQPDAEPQAEGADAPGTSGRQAEDRAPLAARPPSGNKQQPDQPGAGAHVGRTGATGGGSTGRPAGGRKRAAAAAAAAAAEGASCGAPVVGGTSATGTAGPSRQVGVVC